QEKIPFTPVIVQFDKGLNRTDIAYAFEFCKTHQLSPEIIHLDILKFFKDSVHTPYILANGAHLMQMHIMRHVHNLGGVAVIGVGEQRYERMNGKIVLPVALERIAVTHFMQQEQIDGVSAFYCYTPEIMLCLLQEAKLIGFDFISRFAHNIKSSIYRKYWPHMSPRLKLSGLEDVSLARHELENHLLNKYKTEYAANFSQKYLIPIELFEKQLTHGLTA
ncbi:MAG: hypothetical protein K2Q32_05340, partial [Alphaproteobacteria bacterium]|nr:hypothetical protein [Alphaproteobacteria bacterium]